MSLRLLAICPTARYGGTESYTLTIAAAARQRGWDVRVVTSRQRFEAGGREELTACGLESVAANIVEGGDHSRRQLPRLLRGMRLLMRHRPDVVHINVPWPNRCGGLIAACALLGVPAVVTHHLIPRPFGYSPRQRLLLSWARRRRQTWTAVSQYTQRLLCQALRAGGEEVRCIYNGVSIEPLPDGSERGLLRHAVRHELGLEPDAFLAVTTGRLVPQKGLNRLIQAMPMVLEVAPDFRVLVAGDGMLKSEVAEQARRYGVQDRFVLLGERRDVPRLLRAADLFVFPTLYEGFGLALLEAMAAGLPVVSTDTCNIPEIVTHGVEGLLCHPDDSAGLAQSLRWAMTHRDDMRAMGLRARARAEDFGQDRMIDATLEVLEQTARGVAEGSAAEQRPASASAAAAECAEPTAAHAPLR